MTTRTQTLAEFLLARIAEDEEAADEPVMHERGLCDRCDRARMVGDEKRWRAVCAAHRRIVEEHADHNESLITSRGLFPCDTLRALASAYADRDGWQEEWR